MAKRAVLIGCNYPGTKAELRGCVNDVKRMYACLVERFGFSEDDITVMVDTDKQSVQPTGANIKKVLSNLVRASEPGDILVMHYSGHGTQVPDESGDSDNDGLDEAIVPTDLNLLTDDDFRVLLSNVQPGVQFTFISDSCHSGGLLDHEKEQIGGGPGAPTRGFAPPSTARVGARSYDAGYERDAGEYESRERYGRREYNEEPGEYEREERHSHHEGGRGQHHGRGGEGEYEREEGYGRHGRREEPEYEREEGYGRSGRGASYGGGYEQEGGYRQGASYGRGYEQGEGYGQGGGYQQGEDYGRRPNYGEGYQQGEGYGGGYQQPGGGYGQGARQGAGYQQGGGYERRASHKDKSLSLETLTQMLSQQSGQEVLPGNIRASLYNLFGEDASPTVKVFVNLMASKLTGASGGGEEGGLMGTIGALAMNFMKAKLNEGDSSYAQPGSVLHNLVPQSAAAGLKPSQSRRLSDDVGTLVSGCQSNETSADVNATGRPQDAYGALSNGIQTVLSKTRGPISNKELVTGVRDLLQQQGFAQHPCLYSSDDNVHAMFICE